MSVPGIDDFGDAGRVTHASNVPETCHVDSGDAGRVTDAFIVPGMLETERA